MHRRQHRLYSSLLLKTAKPSISTVAIIRKSLSTTKVHLLFQIIKSLPISSSSRPSATAGAVYLPQANKEGGAAGYNRGRAPRHKKYRRRPADISGHCNAIQALQCPLDFNNLVSLNNVAHLDVIIICDVKSAILAGKHLLHIILEPLE